MFMRRSAVVANKTGYVFSEFPSPQSSIDTCKRLDEDGKLLTMTGHDGAVTHYQTECLYPGEFKRKEAFSESIVDYNKWSTQQEAQKSRICKK